MSHHQPYIKKACQLSQKSAEVLAMRIAAQFRSGYDHPSKTTSPNAMKPFKSKPLHTPEKVVNPPPAPEVPESKSDSDENPGMPLHRCSCNGTPGGYGHVADACFEDYKGYLWIVSASGRRMSQVKFCPFCGFQALNEPEVLETLEGSTEDQLTTPPDRPQRVWKRFSEPYRMEHFRFGNVRVYATDGCHAKVKSELHKQLLTVCVENLSPIVGIPCLPKVGEKKESKPKKDQAKAVEEMVNKYSFL